MRYFLDTNILVFIFVDPEEIDKNVLRIIEDYNTQLYTSSVCIQEMIHLIQIGKFGSSKIKTSTIFSQIKDSNIKIVPITENDLKVYSSLILYEGHTDPNDRLIIAQAISCKIPLISSDRKFELYKKNGLNFILNKR